MVGVWQPHSLPGDSKSAQNARISSKGFMSFKDERDAESKDAKTFSFHGTKANTHSALELRKWRLHFFSYNSKLWSTS